MQVSWEKHRKPPACVAATEDASISTAEANKWVNKFDEFRLEKVSHMLIEQSKMISPHQAQDRTVWSFGRDTYHVTSPILSTTRNVHSPRGEINSDGATICMLRATGNINHGHETAQSRQTGLRILNSCHWGVSLSERETPKDMFENTENWKKTVVTLPEHWTAMGIPEDLKKTFF